MYFLIKLYRYVEHIHGEKLEFFETSKYIFRISQYIFHISQNIGLHGARELNCYKHLDEDCLTVPRPSSKLARMI